ncbi:MAG TPA: thioredoxin [Bdellovibrionota bacterium]|nr:thioredoxin [Bdellovibrionota bacterium]
MNKSTLVKNLSDENFNAEVLADAGITMVDFWAPWCGPCRAIAPVIDALATQYEGQVSITKVNVDENPRVATDYEIRGIPTTLFFKNGKLVDRIVGAVPKDDFQKSIERLLRE